MLVSWTRTSSLGDEFEADEAEWGGGGGMHVGVGDPPRSDRYPLATLWGSPIKSCPQRCSPTQPQTHKETDVSLTG